MLCALSQKSFTLFWIHVSLSKFSEKVKNDIKISVGRAVPELLIKMRKTLFWSTTPALFGLLKF